MRFPLASLARVTVTGRLLVMVLLTVSTLLTTVVNTFNPSLREMPFVTAKVWSL